MLKNKLTNYNTTQLFIAVGLLMIYIILGMTYGYEYVFYEVFVKGLLVIGSLFVGTVVFIWFLMLVAAFIMWAMVVALFPFLWMSGELPPDWHKALWKKK